METIQNTLYVTTQGAYLSKDHETIRVEVERECKLSLPLHHLESIAVFGNVLVSPFLMAACAEKGIALTFLSENGRLLARVDAPGSGNVLLRRAQMRKADDEKIKIDLSRMIVAGKIQNARVLLLRAARESAEETVQEISLAAESLKRPLLSLQSAGSVDSIRGYEGHAAEVFFSIFPKLIKQQESDFQFQTRTRRPPRDPANALFSFVYALLLRDCVAALTSAGLDPSVGFLHDDRPGKPSLALDLMEEFRPLIADRLVLKAINKRLVNAGHFERREGGACLLNDAGRKIVIGEYQQRKLEEVEHPLLQQKSRFGMLPFLQARLLVRYLRGDLEAYPPCVIR